MILTRLLAIVSLIASIGQVTLRDIAPQLEMDGYLFLVNRQNTISASYVPPDLVLPDVPASSSAVAGNIYMRQDAARALEAMFAAAKEEAGLTFTAVSGYRSFSTQSAIYNNKVKKVGVKEAQRYSAPPGASEHQLGLAMDVNGKSRAGSVGLVASFGESEEGIWLSQNAHRFGFILRYQKGWEDITGYEYEPWHVRYVGPEHAQAVYTLNVPFEEYVAQLRVAILTELAERQKEE